MLKHYTLFLIVFLLSQIATAQINFDFEGNGSGSVEGWSYTCEEPTLENEGVDGFSNWSMKVASGNTQGCFYAHVYQVFDTVPNNIEELVVSVSARSLGGIASLSLGKIALDGDIVITDIDTTSSTTWTDMSVQFTGDLEMGEKFAVILDAGLTGGPALPEYVLFDNVSFAWPLNNTSVKKNPSFTISPNPAREYIEVHIREGLSNSEIVVYNLLGIPIYCPSSVVTPGNVSLEVGQLPEGNYILQLIDQEQRKTARKFIVTR